MVATKVADRIVHYGEHQAKLFTTVKENEPKRSFRIHAWIDGHHAEAWVECQNYIWNKYKVSDENGRIGEYPSSEDALGNAIHAAGGMATSRWKKYITEQNTRQYDAYKEMRDVVAQNKKPGTVIEERVQAAMEASNSNWMPAVINSIPEEKIPEVAGPIDPKLIRYLRESLENCNLRDKNTLRISNLMEASEKVLAALDKNEEERKERKRTEEFFNPKWIDKSGVLMMHRKFPAAAVGALQNAVSTGDPFLMRNAINGFLMNIGEKL